MNTQNRYGGVQAARFGAQDAAALQYMAEMEMEMEDEYDDEYYDEEMDLEEMDPNQPIYTANVGGQQVMVNA